MKLARRRLPAEWEKHRGILLSFPHNGNDWPGKYQAIQWAFVDFIKKVSRYERVLLLVKSDEHHSKVKSMLKKAHIDLSAIDFIIQDTNRSWMRDSGPIIVKNETGSLEALQFLFTGWAKYPNHKKDQRIPATVANHLTIPHTNVIYKNQEVVLEGGAIESNGCGTLITTEECLLDERIQVRNPGFTKADYETIFNDYFGVTNVIWLGEGIEGDDTHGHVDDICRFVNATTVIACEEKNTNDPNHKRLKSNLEQLKNVKLENGESLNCVTIPMPDRLDFEKMRLPASYVNFLIINDGVLVPTFNDKNDYKALGIITDLFPNRDVIGINATDLVWGLGTLHCLSHEIPK